QGANVLASTAHDALAAPATVKMNVGVLSFVSAGGFTNAIVGGAVSTVNDADAVAELPAASVARTAIVRAPSARPFAVNGDVHAANAPVSTAHAIATASAPALKATATSALATCAGGALVIATAGGTVSTVQLNCAVDRLPTASLARTSKPCAPSA